MSGSHMPWLDALDENISPEERKYLNDHDFYFGLYTSIQFEQSEERGLVLEPATTGMIAGVYIASSMDDERDAAVPTAKTAKTWSLDTHYTKAESYTRAEIEGKLAGKASLEEMSEHKRRVNEAIAGHNRSVSQTLGNYDNYIHTQLFTKAEFNKAKQEFMTRTENWHGSVVMTENAYNALPELDDTTMYFLTAED